jgi:hypothetical protein
MSISSYIYWRPWLCDDPTTKPVRTALKFHIRNCDPLIVQLMCPHDGKFPVISVNTITTCASYYLKLEARSDGIRVNCQIEPLLAG